MKRVIKNILMIFIICFTILNILGLIFNKINQYYVIAKEVTPILNGEIDNQIIENENNLYNSYKEMYGENAPIATLAYFQGYVMGETEILEMQQTILIISVFIGISVGIITSLTEKSKIKEVLIFIVLGLALALIIHLIERLPSVFFTADMLKIPYWMCYILIYVVVYIIKYFIGKKNAKRLNNELINTQNKIK